MKRAETESRILLEGKARHRILLHPDVLAGAAPRRQSAMA
jgi:hypothetical protein